MSLAWPDEPEFTPYAALSTLPAQSVLVLAPHPDDEVLGCGGLIATLLQRSVPVTVVVASDGAQAGDAGRREQESREAARVLAQGGSPLALQFWRLPDRGLAAVPGLVGRVLHLLTTVDADTVLLPSPFEVHPDHRALCLAGLHALRQLDRAPSTWFYEVGQPLMPDVLVDITPLLERKRQALRCFATQLALQAYDEQLLALNRYRAYTLGTRITHAEAFQRVPAEQLVAGVDAVIDGVAQRLRRRFSSPG